MRPSYESPQDRARERQAIERWGHELASDIGAAVKLPTFYEIDFAFVRGGAVQIFAEVKCRHNAQRAYPTLMLSLHKWQALKRLDCYALVGSVLVVQWTDILGYLWVDEIEVRRTSWNGREDRGDVQDCEPVVHLPIAAFCT